MGAAKETVVSEGLIRGALDTLPVHVAVLDEHGTVLAINETWEAFTEPHPFVGRRHGIGTSLLELCRRAVAERTAEAHVLAGLREVLERREERFEIEYSCPTADGPETLTVPLYVDGGPMSTKETLPSQSRSRSAGGTSPSRASCTARSAEKRKKATGKTRMKVKSARLRFRTPPGSWALPA